MTPTALATAANVRLTPRGVVCLWWTQVYHFLVSTAPTRPIVSIHCFCGSAGTLKFFDKPSYKERHQVHKWCVVAAPPPRPRWM